MALRCELVIDPDDMFASERVCGGMLHHVGKGSDEERVCSKCGTVWSTDKFEEYPT